jgi:hypothetical protein
MKFAHHTPCGNASLREMTCSGFGHTRGAPVAERDLHSAVAVILNGFDLSHAIIRHIEHSYGHRITVIRKNAHHADLATQ